MSLLPLMTVSVALVALWSQTSLACRKPDSHGPYIPPGGGGGWQGTWRFRREIKSSEDAEVILKICDADGNGLISKTELQRCFHLPALQAKKYYQKLQKDENTELSLEDITKGSLITFQVYVDCVADYKDKCDMPVMISFRHALEDMIMSSADDGICDSVDTSKFVISTKSKDAYATLPCSKKAIVDCDVMFLDDLNAGQDGCSSLENYKECLGEMTEMCDDDPARYARAGSHSLVTAYMGNNVC